MECVRVKILGYSASFQTRMKLSEFVHKVTRYIFLVGGKNNIGKI